MMTFLQIYLKPISQLRFDTIRWHHDAFDNNGSDWNYDTCSIRLRHDYDMTTTKNWHVHFLLVSNGSRSARQSDRSQITIVITAFVMWFTRALLNKTQFMSYTLHTFTTTDLYQPWQLGTFHVIQLGWQNKTSTSDQLAFWLVHETLTTNNDTSAPFQQQWPLLAVVQLMLNDRIARGPAFPRQISPNSVVIRRCCINWQQ